MSSYSILTKLDALPENLKQEVIDFIDFLAQKSGTPKNNMTRQAGSAKGMIIMAPDFDEPLDDFKDYM